MPLSEPRSLSRLSYSEDLSGRPERPDVSDLDLFIIMRIAAQFMIDFFPTIVSVIFFHAHHSNK